MASSTQSPANGTSLDDASGANIGNAANVVASDDTYAQTTISLGGNHTDYFVAYDFDFSAIPDGSSIDGVIAHVEAKKNQATTGAFRHVYRYNGSAVEGDDQAAGEGLVEDVDTVFDFGAADDPWGWILSTIQDPAYGFAASFDAAMGQTITVDHMPMTVHYTPPAAGRTIIGSPTISAQRRLTAQAGVIGTTVINHLRRAA